MAGINYPLYIFLGIIPSIIWFAYYLRKDPHPEPRKQIIKVFLLGVVSTFPAIIIEVGLREMLDAFFPFTRAILFLYIFLGIALTEEFLKYSTVKLGMLNRKDRVDVEEPVDFMSYMIIAALGFAALENTLVLFGLPNYTPISEVLSLAILRFAGATFLHAVASGIFGYFIALSYLNPQKRLLYFLLGLGIATTLHGFFNLYIIEGTGMVQIIFPIIILGGAAIFTAFAFKRLKRKKQALRK